MYEATVLASWYEHASVELHRLSPDAVNYMMSPFVLHSQVHLAK